MDKTAASGWGRLFFFKLTTEAQRAQRKRRRRAIVRVKLHLGQVSIREVVVVAR